MEALSRSESRKEFSLLRSLPLPPEWHGRLVTLKDGLWIVAKAPGGSFISDDPEAVWAVAMAAFRAAHKRFAGNSGQYPVVDFANPLASKARMNYCMWRDA
jgi:hypothetical protein